MHEQKGFSLIELLLVVAVILIIAAIAVPNFLRSRMAANEASAVASVHNIESAQVAYQSTYPTFGFASGLSTLGPGTAANTNADSTNALLLDIVLGCPASVGTATCEKSGYNFYITASGSIPIGSYTVNADPVAPGQSGQRHFFSDVSGVIRYSATATATVNDQPIE